MARKPAANPALVPEPVAPSPAEYTVTGAQAVLDHEPGSTFTTTLTPELEAFYLAGGHLTKTTEGS
jgi:hypothetical protein